MLQKMHILLQNRNIRLLLFIVTAFNVLLLNISIYNDLHFFCWNNEFNENKQGLYIVAKCIWTISVVIIECLLALAIVWRKALSKKYGRIFALNTMIYGGTFACLFPGTWGAVGDEFLVYWAAKNMWIWPQQGAMSGLLMIWELMFYPATWTPVLIQLIFTDVAFTRITGKLWNEGRKASAIFFELIMFSAVTMIYTYNPIRIWLFTVAFVAFLAEFYFAWIDGTFSKMQQVYFTFLFCIIVCIRTETKYMLIWGPILFIALLIHCNKPWLWKKIVLKIEIVAVLSIFIVSLIFEYLGGAAYKYNSLSLVSFVCPLSVILTSENAKLDELEVDAIDAVFPVQDLVDNPSATNFWNYKHWIDNYEDVSKTEIRAFKNATVKIFINNLNIFMNSRIQMLYACMPREWIPAAKDITDIKDWGENNHSSSRDIYKDFDFDNSSVRMNCASVLSGKTFISPTMKKIQYSFVVPIILLILSFAVACVKKKIEIVLLLMTAGIEFVLLFLLIPSAANMYYVPFYMVGWGMLGGYIDRVMKNIKSRNGSNCLRKIVS